MKKINRTLWAALVVLTAVPTACERVEMLSDAAEVLQFRIDHSEPATIELADPEIDSREGLITIPLLYGKHDFPLRIRATVALSETAVKTLPPHFDGELTFAAPDSDLSFYVVAASGKVKLWTVRLREIVLDEQTQIDGFTILSCTPETALVARHAKIAHIPSRVHLLAIPGASPLAVVPAIERPAKTTIAGYTEGQPLTFDTPAATTPLTLIAESGKTQVWTVDLVECREVHSLPELSPELRRRLHGPASSLSLSPAGGLEIMDVSSDFATGTIAIAVRGAAFPASIGAVVPVREHTQLVGRAPDDPFTFAQFDEAHSFYIIDNASQSYIRWTVQLKEWKNPAADVVGVAITRHEPATVALRTPATVDALRGTVHIAVTGGVADFPLTVTPEIALAPGASFKTPPPPTFVFATTSDVHEWTVVAESGAEKVWRMKIDDNDPLTPANTATDVRSYKVIRYSSSENPHTGSRVAIEPTAVVDPVARTIRIAITDWKKYFPLTLQAVAELSDGAVIATPGFDDAGELVFDHWTTTKRFTVQAEDPAYTAEWTIAFTDREPAKSAAAAVTGFSVAAAVSEGSAVEVLYIEPGKKQVTLLLSEAALPLRINPAISVSDGACILDLPTGDELLFTTLNTVKTFRLMAEDETTYPWAIVLLHAPPLPNGTMEDWTPDNRNAIGWSNPNATGVTVVAPSSPGFGNAGWAAQLTSRTATILSLNITASGSLFLGSFNYTIAYADQPKLMTRFGIPWAGRPLALEADYIYQRGAPLVNANHEIMPGQDYGSATIELLHWDGTGVFEYHALNGNEGYGTLPSNITVTDRAINETIGNTPGWTTLHLDLQPIDNTKIPNYLHITFASSRQGDRQIGANGSTLKLDNIRLIYYVPEAGAREVRN
ncbi:MAG: PCMD domain-containing protein [Prevotellaceae bacterium]|nr:PCMD domain-containing protein [Prevotellaceae bacterium]